MTEKSITGIVISSIVGFLVFLLLLAIASFLTGYFDNSIYTSVVGFLLSNLVLIFAIMIFTLLAEIFWNLIFPISILGPILSAIASIPIVSFLYRIFILVADLSNTTFIFPFRLDAVYFIVFVLTLLIGLIILVSRVGRRIDGTKRRVEEAGKVPSRTKRRRVVRKRKK
jgi:hypothetical protein